MKIKTSELSGAALDWAVAKCEGDELAALNIQFPEQAKHYRRVSPSSDWAQGGPIIEREGIGLNRGAGSRWMANIHTAGRSEEHTSELQPPLKLVCRLLLE